MPAVESDGLGMRLRDVVEFGNRFSGTRGERACSEFLLDEFERLNLSRVRTEEFAYLAYEPILAACIAVGEDDELPCSPLQNTADGVAEGEAVYIGSGAAAEIDAAEQRVGGLSGRVAVVHSSIPFLVAPLLAQRGIAALVNIGDAPDGLVPHFTAVFYPPPSRPPWEDRVLAFPGVTLEAQAGRRLLTLMTSGPVRVQVQHSARYVEKVAVNVLGEIPGEIEPEQRVVVGAHYDTQLEGVGAWDNGSGVAAILQLAARWRNLRLRRTVLFGAWAVEELGAWGSSSFVTRHAADHTNMIGMVNLDALGGPFSGPRVIFANQAIADFAHESAESVGWSADAKLDASLYPFSDHNPFIDAGIPACSLWHFPAQHPYYHTSRDVLDYVDVDRAAAAATAAGFIAYRLAQSSEPELPHRTRRPAARDLQRASE